MEGLVLEEKACLEPGDFVKQAFIGKQAQAQAPLPALALDSLPDCPLTPSATGPSSQG